MRTEVMPKDVLSNNHGSALIIALIILAVMGLIGATLMDVTTTEIKLTGNYRTHQLSFYAADRTIELATQMTSSEDEDIDLYNDTDSSGSSYRTYLDMETSGLEDPDTSPEAAANTVTYLSTGEPAISTGMDSNLVQARNYLVTAVGISPLSADYPSRTVLRAHFQKIVAKNNDSQF